MQVAIRRYPVGVIGCVYGSSGAVEQCIQPPEKRFCASQRDDREPIPIAIETRAVLEILPEINKGFLAILILTADRE